MPFALEQITNHVIRDRILALKNELGQVQQMESLPNEASSSLGRVATAVQWFEARLEQAQPMLLSVSGLDDLSNRFATIAQSLLSYRSDRSQTHLDNSTSIIEQHVLPRNPAELVLFDPRQSVDLTAPVKELDSFARTAIEDLRKKASLAESQSEKARASQVETANRLDKMRGEIDTAVSNFNTQYQNFQVGLRAEFDKTLEKIKSDSAIQEKNSEAAFASEINSMREASKTEISSIVELKRDAERMVEVASTRVLTGNFKNIADNEGLSAALTRAGAVFFMVLGLGSVGYTVYFNPSSGDTRPDVWADALRVALGLACGFPATYLAYESARHRRNEMRARKNEVELAALGPFLVKLPELKQAELREQLVNKYFGQPFDEGKVDIPPTMITTFTDTVKSMGTAAVEAAKKMSGG